VESVVRDAAYPACALAVTLALSSCNGTEIPAEPGSGGSPVASGGAAVGGSGQGGSIGVGGYGTGGTMPATGGTVTSTGGKATGGTATGGTATGGRASGGTSTGGNASGGRATGGSSGACAYDPCPTNGDACKILPLGDSITWGVGYDGAYRVELFSKAVAAQKKITFTGSLSNGPTTVAGQPFPKSNEGHSGWTIAQDAGLIPSPALNTLPNIVLLHIGTNDVYASSGQATMPDRLGQLMDKIISAAPNALLLVAKITPLTNTSWNATVKTYNDAIPGVVQTRVAAGKHVMLADMNTGFTSSMMSSDGIHPNQSGYNFMGDAWYAAISGCLH
jgi:lysophospholipase L1-like esterase